MGNSDHGTTSVRVGGDDGNGGGLTVGVLGRRHVEARQVVVAHVLLTEIGILLPSNKRQHRTLHNQEDVLPYVLLAR